MLWMICRIMTIEEKRQLGHSLGRLPADNLQRVIQIIAQKNPGFNATADEVEVDIDAQVLLLPLSNAFCRLNP